MKRFAAMLACAAACAASAAPVAGAFPTQPRGAAPIACVVTATKGAMGAENANPTALANVAAVVAELCEVATSRPVAPPPRSDSECRGDEAGEC